MEGVLVARVSPVVVDLLAHGSEVINLRDQIVTRSNDERRSTVAEAALLRRLRIAVAGVRRRDQNALTGVGDRAVQRRLQRVRAGTGGRHNVGREHAFILEIAGNCDQSRMALLRIGAGRRSKIERIDILALGKAEAAHGRLDRHRYAVFINISDALFALAALAAPGSAECRTGQVMVRKISAQRLDTFLHAFYLLFLLFINES